MNLDAMHASIAEHRIAVEALAGMVDEIGTFARRWQDALAAGATLFFCGNGGSAADCQHIAAELSGRFERERPGLRAVALTVDTSALTAIANDYGYERVFARQIEALARPGDVVVCISTSGNSAAVLAAAAAAAAAKAVVLGMTGASGGKLRALCQQCLRVPSSHTARIQELHILVGHLCCQHLDASLAERTPDVR